jgi:hypothetical protein
VLFLQILNGESVEFVRLVAVNEIINQRHHNAASPTLPKVTGARLDQSPSHERFSAPPTKNRSFSSMPKGMKYILATLCSKPGSAFAGCSRVIQSSGEPVDAVALIVQKLNI